MAGIAIMATQMATATAMDPRAIDVRAERAKPDLRRFAMLALPLALLLGIFKLYTIEEPAFFTLACLVFGGFAVSYWLPFRYKEVFLIALSLAGSWVLLGPAIAGLLVASGLAMFSVIASRLGFRWKICILLGVFAGAVYGRLGGLIAIPRGLWPVFGSMFVCRMIVYLYDIKHTSGRPKARDYLSYFFLLPNYYFMFFPVVDYRTFRASFFKRDIHVVAQQGVWWIFRGVTHLLFYRLIYQAQASLSPPHVPVAAAVIAKSVSAYLLYTRISGQFHIIAGMLCLFGYDLPETNHRYLLANSIADMWRRNNIYWKDFMVKVFYFPAYFKMRRQGDLRAQTLATALVFAATWFLHALQFFWLQGKFRMALNDTVFWIILGSLVMADVWVRSRNPRRPPARGWTPRLMNAMKIAATFALMSALWAMWSTPGFGAWFVFLKTGNI
jgi:hypothetical protein